MVQVLTTLPPPTQIHSIKQKHAVISHADLLLEEGLEDSGALAYDGDFDSSDDDDDYDYDNDDDDPSVSAFCHSHIFLVWAAMLVLGFGLFPLIGLPFWVQLTVTVLVSVAVLLGFGIHWMM